MLWWLAAFHWFAVDFEGRPSWYSARWESTAARNVKYTLLLPHGWHPFLIGYPRRRG